MDARRRPAPAGTASSDTTTHRSAAAGAYRPRGMSAIASISVIDLGSRVGVVAVQGELDLLSQLELEFALGTAAAGGRAVVVDLCACDFIDSATLSSLVAAQRSCAALALSCTRISTASSPSRISERRCST